ERPQLLAVVERPHIAVVRAQHFWRALFEAARYALLPELGRFVRVRVGVDDRMVDAGDFEEQIGHRRASGREGTTKTGLRSTPDSGGRRAVAAGAVRGRRFFRRSQSGGDGAGPSKPEVAGRPPSPV